MTISSYRRVGILLLLCCLASMAWSEVSLPAIFSDNMVLQQDQRVPVWGWAKPGEKVTVTFAGKSATTTADDQGRWKTRIQVPKADNKPYELVIEGNNRVSFTNVVAGEVWVCSGQSNMEYSLAGSTTGKEAVASANFPMIRLFKARMWATAEPQQNLQGQWSVCSLKTAGGYSAVGYFMVRHLHQTLNVPVGLIDSTSGGTAAEGWISQPTMEADPVLKALVHTEPEFFKTVEQYGRDWDDYQKAQAEHRNPMPAYPKSPFRGWGYPTSSFYNAMIAPLIPFAIKGAAWYQGEAKTGRMTQYAYELSALIKDWRTNWGEGDFTFLIVQLPNIEPTWNWPVTREQQLHVVATVPNTGLAVTVGDRTDTDIHPRNKEVVGDRLAISALGVAYHKKIEYSGPIYASMKVAGNEIRLSFNHVGGGLTAKGTAELTGFTIAGADQKFVPAKAVIAGDTVVVSSPDVPNPVAVRYAFEDNPACNLYNGAGLPASPFRTDDWPLAL